MSSEAIVAKRYAKALFELASTAGNVAQVGEDVAAVVATIQGDADFNGLLQHPNIDLSVKLELLEKAFAGKVAESVLRTVQLLVQRRRQAILPELATAYQAIANEALGQAQAIVTTPAALTEKEASELKATFGRITGKTIVIENVVDPKLLGGMKVKIGDRLYDGSLSGKLERLEKTLQSTQAL